MNEVMEDNNALLRKHLVEILNEGSAHVSFENAIAHMPFKLAGVRPENIPYSVWELCEHIRIAQWDMVEFCKNPKHKSPKWPDKYWPLTKGPISQDQFDKCIDQIKTDLQRMVLMIEDFNNDLFTPFPHGTGQNLLKEALQLADHTSYHTGEIIIIRRLLKVWTE